MEPSLLLCSWQKEFRNAWKNGTPLNLRDFLARCLSELPPGCDSDEFLIEVLAIDLDFQWGQYNTNRKTVDDYVALLPPGSISESTLRVLLIEEFRLRRAAGDGPSLEDYRRRLRELQATTDEINNLETLTSHAGDTVHLKSTTVDLVPKLSRYIIHEPIGNGGMGTVFRATHRASRTEVAVKILTSIHPEMIQRFVAEAEAAMKLSHPNIVRVMDVDQEDGVYFMSMEFLRGGNLDELVADGKTLPPIEAARALIPIAQAIDYANRQSIIHRDIKPSNILIDEYLTLKISDFGLAKQFRVDNNEDSPHTQLGQILGTPEYMSPEQAIGDNRNVKRHADIYSLGAVLYRLVIGQPPFKGADPLDTVSLVREGSLILPRELLPSIPPDLEAIILQCLQYNPRDRYYSAGALADDLDKFISGAPIRARGEKLPGRGMRVLRRNLSKFLPLVILTAFAVFSATLINFFSRHEVDVSRKTRRLLKEQQTEFDKHEADYARRMQLMETKLYAAELRHAYQLICGGDRHLAKDVLDRMPHQFTDWPKVSGIEWYWLKSICGDDKIKRLTGLGRVRHVAVKSSIGGRVFASGDNSRSDQLLSFDLGLGSHLAETIILPLATRGLNSLAYNEASQTLAITGFAPEIWFLGLKDAGGVKFRLGVTVDHPDSEKSAIVNWQISSLVFSHDGACLWIGDTHGNVIALKNESADGQAPFKESSQKTVATLNSRIATIAVSESGFVVVGASNGETIRIGMGDAVEPITKRSDTTKLKSIAISKDGQTLALATSEGLRLIPLADQAVEAHIRAQPDATFGCECAAWICDDSLLVVGGFDGHIRAFDSRTRRLCGQIIAHKSPIDGLSATDDYIISTAGDGSVFSCALESLTSFKPHKPEDEMDRLIDTSDVAIHSDHFNIPKDAIRRKCLAVDDGRAIVWLSTDQDFLTIWDRVTGEPLLKINLPTEKLETVLWEPHSKRCIIFDQQQRRWTLLFPVKNED